MSSSSEINSIVRAAEILKCLSNGINKLTELSRRLDVNKATVHQILKTLEGRGLVSQNPDTRKYYLGPLIQTLAENPIVVHRIVSELALPEMERLRDLFNETVVLQIRRGGQRMVLEKVSSNQIMDYFPEKTELAPIYAGAAGKVLLSQMHSLLATNLFERLELVKVGSNTITDKRQLTAELEEIRTKGYAVSISETITNAAALAVPLLNYTCPVALAIVGPDDQILARKVLILSELMKSGDHISMKIKEVTGIKNAKDSN